MVNADAAGGWIMAVVVLDCCVGVCVEGESDPWSRWLCWGGCSKVVDVAVSMLDGSSEACSYVLVLAELVAVVLAAFGCVVFPGSRPLS